MLVQTITQSKVLSIAFPTLAQDDYGLEVAVLQRLLILYGYLARTVVNGIFESDTDDAVRQFQHDNGLFEDGIVGPHTWSALADLD
ncbi:peptidoglycan-binding protein [Kovacikia minuta CCNUW1]|uniref:peptidoglycan-binding domain-containing protein n=1 Tax=Kovacikia minuta TaxID=2931930 RepID=UPI001CCA28D1|nr:peptidoglycan-binding domain-containing protein [Kovacikia minuta]UBF26347.1 peptidoglycan-binding protein [Kovacikia minuta CCNUW1]